MMADNVTEIRTGYLQDAVLEFRVLSLHIVCKNEVNRVHS